jgi:hypothetical protein
MLIEIMGDAGCRVAELVADDLDVDTALQRDRRRRVPGVVEPHDRQTVVTVRRTDPRLSDPALGALGLTESNEDVNQFLIAFDALLVEAGVAEALIAHHMGHVEERPARRRWATSSRRPNAQARSGSSVSDEVRRIVTSSPRSPKSFHQFQVIPHDSRIAGSVLIP